MVDDIRNTDILKDMSANEIKNVLGEPDNIEDYVETTKYIYNSGNGSFIVIYIENDKYKGIILINLL